MPLGLVGCSVIWIRCKSLLVVSYSRSSSVTLTRSLTMIRSSFQSHTTPFPLLAVDLQANKENKSNIIGGELVPLSNPLLEYSVCESRLSPRPCLLRSLTSTFFPQTNSALTTQVYPHSHPHPTSEQPTQHSASPPSTNPPGSSLPPLSSSMNSTSQQANSPVLPLVRSLRSSTPHYQNPLARASNLTLRCCRIHFLV